MSDYGNADFSQLEKIMWQPFLAEL